MPTVKRRATRDQLTRPGQERLSDGIGGTITGGPVERIDLMEILNRGRGVSRCGAVSGAAQSVAGSVVSGPGHRAGAGERGIALSDGSWITFASIADAGPRAERDTELLADL